MAEWKITTHAVGEEGPTTSSTFGEEDYTSDSIGEEGGPHYPEEQYQTDNPFGSY
jgi:hypothetical protein